jgi:hypothetical protein
MVGTRLTGASTRTVTVPFTVPPRLSETVTASWKSVSTVTWGAVHEGLARVVLLKLPGGDTGVCVHA